MKKPSSKKFTKQIQAEKEKLPSNSRKIPETKSFFQLLLNKYFIVSFLCAFIGVAVALQGISLKNSLQTLSILEGKKESIQRDVAYWEKVTTEHKGYRDGYFKLALLNYQLGDTVKAKVYAEKALTVDPNFKPARDLLEEMGYPYSL